MELKFNIDDSKINERIAQELDIISEEEIKNVIIDAIKQEIHSEKSPLYNILFDKDGYWGTYRYDRPSKYLKDLLDDSDVNKEVNDLKNEVIASMKEYIKNTSIVKELLGRFIIDLFCDNLTNAITGNNRFQNEIIEKMNMNMHEHMMSYHHNG